MSTTRRCSQFSIEEIKAATNQFDSSKILGQGGEAKVYFAEIYVDSNKTPVAVKHLKDNSKAFQREVHTLSKIQHPNIVSLIGYCDDSGHKILVYEYMEKGCLSDYLRKKSSRISLSWLQRLNICLGAALGLQHLHTETDEFPKGIIHRDVKPGNILVDENWVGKLSDFGLFKLSNTGQDKSLMTTNLKGTNGYYAPEYIKYNRVTRKIDVYSFGVVLFQVLCCKMPWDRGDDSYYAEEDENLGLWAKQNVDAQIQGEILEDSLTVFTDIIGRSLQGNPGIRPTMDGVVLDLQKAIECQESGNLAKKTEDSIGFLPKAPSSSSFHSQVKGKKREWHGKGPDTIRHKRLSAIVDDAEFGQPRSEQVLKSEIAKITDKYGLVDFEGVEKLVKLMQPEKKIDLGCRIMLVDAISVTNRLVCLDKFVQLRGLHVLDEWLREVHKGTIGNDSPKESEELIFALLRALGRLPVNLRVLQTHNVGRSVNSLRAHKNSEVQRKARNLVDTWKKCVEVEMRGRLEDVEQSTNQECPPLDARRPLGHREGGSI